MTAMVGDDKIVVPFRPPETAPPNDEERARRLRVEVERLARLPTVEWKFYASQEDHAQQYGVTTDELRELVQSIVKENEKKAAQAKAEERRQEERVERQRAVTQRKEEELRRKDQARAEKEAERKQREQTKELTKLLKLPAAEQEPRLAALAKRLDVGLDVLRDEFAELATVELESTIETGDVEPWPEPVDTLTLLNELMVQLRRYVVFHDEAAAVAIVSWICFAWVHASAVHSPLLVVTAAAGDEGKTTLCGLIKYLTPRAYAAVELTGPVLYRFVDQVKPTLIIDDADNLLARRPDLIHIINAGWTRGTKIPRQDHGVTRWFDPFCPKVISGVNVQLPKTTSTRKIQIKLWPKLPHEKVEDFGHEDNDDLITFRRKLARWSADNTAAVKDARPVMPKDFNNRVRMNWVLLLAIADLARGDWPKLARKTATRLARERRDPSENRRALAKFQELFTARGEMLTSVQVQELFAADPSGEWADWNGPGRPITKGQIAKLLDPFEIHPGVIHPRGRKADRGYHVAWCAKAFLHYLQTPAGKRTPVRKPRKNSEK